MSYKDTTSIGVCINTIMMQALLLRGTSDLSSIIYWSKFYYLAAGMFCVFFYSCTDLLIRACHTAWIHGYGIHKCCCHSAQRGGGWLCLWYTYTDKHDLVVWIHSSPVAAEDKWIQISIQYTPPIYTTNLTHEKPVMVAEWVERLPPVLFSKIWGIRSLWVWIWTSQFSNPGRVKPMTWKLMLVAP